MKHTAAKVIRALCGMVVMLAFAAGITSVPVLAASNGIYLATATPHYKHPVTGQIEDAGGDGSAVLGQSMTESALYRQALVEVDPQGNMYVTVRLKLMDNIRDPAFQVDGSPVNAALMQEDYSVNTADYRMRVNRETSVIRCNMYVIAMGREVVFYITVSDLQSGSGDFVTSVTVAAPKPVQSEPAAEKPAASKPAAAPSKPAAAPSSAAPAVPETSAPAVPETSSAAPSSETPIASSAPVSETPASSDGASERPAAGLQEFDEAGNRVDEADAPQTEKRSSAAVWPVLGGIAAVLAVGGCVWYFGWFRKKK